MLSRKRLKCLVEILPANEIKIMQFPLVTPVVNHLKQISTADTNVHIASYDKRVLSGYSVHTFVYCMLVGTYFQFSNFLQFSLKADSEQLTHIQVRLQETEADRKSFEQKAAANEALLVRVFFLSFQFKFLSLGKGHDRTQSTEITLR